MITLTSTACSGRCQRRRPRTSCCWNNACTNKNYVDKQILDLSGTVARLPSLARLKPNLNWFPRLPAAHAGHEKKPAASDSVPNPKMKDIFLAVPVKGLIKGGYDSKDAPCPIDTQIGSDLQMLGGFFATLIENTLPWSVMIQYATQTAGEKLEENKKRFTFPSCASFCYDVRKKKKKEGKKRESAVDHRVH